MARTIIKLYMDPVLWAGVRQAAFGLGMTASAWMAMAAANQMDPHHPHIAVAFGEGEATPVVTRPAFRPAPKPGGSKR